MTTDTQDLDFALIGHSHSVALLDGITNWRQKISATGNPEADHRYGQSFQGWFTGTFPDDAFKVSVEDTALSSGSIQVQVITAASRLRTTIAVEQRNGQEVLIPQERFL